MRALTNANAIDLREAIALAQEAERQGKTWAFTGGGTDLLQRLKDRVVEPDVLVHLRTIPDLDTVEAKEEGIVLGGLVTLDELSRHPVIREAYAALAEAAGSVATPQIRNVGTLAGNVCQRPWCWYYRNGFPCFKAGGNTCYSVTGENQLHAIFGGGPSFIVHPSDVAPALVALDGRFRIVGPDGERMVTGSEFFTLPTVDPARENVLGDTDILASVEIPAQAAGTRSTYRKIMDREAWTHAVVSAAVVLEMDGEICRAARIALGGVAPIPWRVPDAEGLLGGQRITPELALAVGEAAVAGARPLAKNGYKVGLARAVVEQTVLGLGTAAPRATG